MIDGAGLRGSYLRLIDSCITQLEDQEASRTCNESKKEKKKAHAKSPPKILSSKVPRLTLLSSVRSLMSWSSRIFYVPGNEDVMIGVSI